MKNIICLLIIGLSLLGACSKKHVTTFEEASRKTIAAYAEARKYPVLSEGWTTNKDLGDKWLQEMLRLYDGEGKP